MLHFVLGVSVFALLVAVLALILVFAVRKSNTSEAIAESGEDKLIPERMDDSEVKKAVFDFLKERSKIYEEQTERSEMSAENYLWLANAGLAAAIVTLDSRTGAALNGWVTKAALICFVFSMALIGLIKANRIVRNYLLKGNFKKNHLRFLRSEVSLEHILRVDREVSGSAKFLIVCAWLCYGLFLAGVGLIAFAIYQR